MPPGLTPTSYAILGLLAIKPWTTYELTRQMHRAVGQFWPRAESRLYEEPKKLVAHGLATAAPGRVGQRPRTVYAITPDGRRALAEWISMPAGSTPELHAEAMIKVFFAEHGSREDLLATIARVLEWTDERLEVSAAIAREYLQGEGSFPDRLPWLVLTGRLLDEHVLAVRQWAEWATGVVETWPDDITRAQPPLDALHVMAGRINATLRSTAQRSGTHRSRDAEGQQRRG
jgi:PadR family transcriptional regulator, regulatory protein AphA